MVLTFTINVPLSTGITVPERSFIHIALNILTNRSHVPDLENPKYALTNGLCI